MTLEEAVKFCEDYLKEQSIKYPQLKGWKVVINNRKGSFGTCCERKKEIALSSILIPNCTDDSIWNTITHETAHAIVGVRHVHDNVWRRQHILLGGDGKRTNGNESYKIDADIVHQNIYKFVAVCKFCGEKHYRQKRSTKKYSCNCGGKYFNKERILEFKINQ